MSRSSLFREKNRIYRNDVNDTCKKICDCGHVIFIPVQVDKVLCDWCGNYYYRDDKDNFEHKLKKAMYDVSKRN